MDDVARRIGEIRAREEAATPAMWFAPDQQSPFISTASNDWIAILWDSKYEENFPNAAANAAFIAHIRQDARWLLGVAEAAHAFCTAPTAQRSDAERALYIALRMTPPAPRAGEEGAQQ